MSMQIRIDGIPVTIIRKKIKNMHLRVKPPEGEVSVSAPMRMDQAIIEQFVSSHTDWIRRQQERIRARAKEPGRMENHYVDGEKFFLWGRPYVLRIEEQEKGRNSLEIVERAVSEEVRGSVEKDGRAVSDEVRGSVEEGRTVGMARLCIRRGSSEKQRADFVKKWYRDRLNLEMKRLLPKWQEAMGLYCSGWQIKDMKTRWGTCNVQTGKIWMNLQLAKLPKDCLEYVIVHELSHLKERHHNEYFWAIVGEYIPQWREIRERMNG